MSGWNDLLRLGITLRPFDTPPPSGSTRSPFEASLGNTLGILEWELSQLGATKTVLQVGYRDGDLRIDGMPRATAKLQHDAVALSFTSIWGPLRYETNEFVPGWGNRSPGWQSNLRAIALAMEALRKVDRYGVSKRGEQYTGWRALPKSTDAADRIETGEEALEVLERYMEPGDGLATVLKRAVRATHPDQNPDKDGSEFRAVMKAKEVLGL